MLSVLTDEAGRTELAMGPDELVREGARRMLAAALEAEVDAYLVAHHDQVDECGHRLVRRNGHVPARRLATAAGPVEVTRHGSTTAASTRPRASGPGSPACSCRAGAAAARRSQVLPLLYLHGLSSQDFVPA